MRRFRDHPPHRQTMPKLAKWCDEAAIANWSQGSDAIPAWTEAARRLVAGGRLTKLSHPSPNQAAGRIVID